MLFSNLLKYGSSEASQSPPQSRNADFVMPISASNCRLNIPRQLNFLAPTAIDDLIRVGRHNDGGYVIPEFVIEKTEVLISFGICDDWSFEAQFLSLAPHLLQLHAYDDTISRNYFIKKTLHETKSLLYGRSNLANIRNKVEVLRGYSSFFVGKARHFKERIHNKKTWKGEATLNDVFDRIEPAKAVFIKMDIEGSEYRVILDILRYSKNILGMVIEFHDVGTLRDTFVNCVLKLQREYELVHLHANNNDSPAVDGVPEVLEITFVKKGFCKCTNKRRSLPISGLDEPNVPTKPDFSLSFNIQGSL